MSSTKNIKVKLRDQEASLTCISTGWTIARTQEKWTPKSDSAQIQAWVKYGALIVIDRASEPSGGGTDEGDAKLKELLDEPTSGKNREALLILAQQINALEDKAIINIDDTTVNKLKDEIAAWKEIYTNA